MLPVPSLFRQTSINSGERREATSTKNAAQTAYAQVRHALSQVRAVLRQTTARPQRFRTLGVAYQTRCGG
jgi:hypothetical protein